MAIGTRPDGRSAAWPEVAFTRSPLPILLLLAGSALLTLGGAAIVLGWIDGIEPWSKAWLAGWAGIVFFPFCAVLWLAQAMTPGPVVTIGPRGVRDTRLSPDWIPWSAILRIAEAKIQRTRLLTLHIDPAFEATMRLTRVARWSRPANAAIGHRGLHITGVGLRGGFIALKHVIEDGAVRARNG